MKLLVYCPGCGDALEGKRSELRRDLNFHCHDCGVQIFFRGHRGIARFLRVRQGQGVIYRWVICSQCKIAVNQDRLQWKPECPGCGLTLIHGFEGTEEYSEEEVEKWKSGDK
ncbi:MAG TPA: hypothetical protein ENI27_10960 [bacterium]|nr:hypothetical protein [bacterium]